MQQLIYFGERILVPDVAKWVAIDADGDVCAFTNPPVAETDDDCMYWDCSGGMYFTLPESMDREDWRSSLRHVDDLEKWT